MKRGCCQWVMASGTIRSKSAKIASIASPSSGGAAGIFPYIQVFDLPYLMRDDRVAEHVLSGEFVNLLRQGVASATPGS